MFLALEEVVGSLYQIKLLNTENGEYATILPDFGGNVNQLVLAKADKKLLSVVEGYVTTEAAQENAGYRSSKLIPFPNRLFDGKYEFEKKTYQCDISRPQEGHAIHGLWHSRKMHVIKLKSTDKKATLHLLYNYKGSDAGYPFKCSILYKYRLSDKGFRCTTEVLNEGKTPIPFGDGWHPYFKLDSETIDTLSLTVPPVRFLPVNTRKVPTGEAVSFLDFFQGAPLANVDLDHGFKLLQPNGKAITTLHNPATATILDIWQEAGLGQYDFLQIYTPNDRKTIAIEPMTCAADAFNNGLGTIIIAPKGFWKGKYGVCMRV
ncbi:MAG: hypothetical protein RI894_232 [Bacteroidota bacterium]